MVKQPDSVELVEQLRTEYATFEEVMDKGGELDLDKLETQIQQINHGLDFVNMNEAIGRWSALKDLEAKLAGSTALAEAQERSNLLVRLGETAKKFEGDVAVAAARNLDFVLDHLLLEGKIDIPEDDHEYAGEVARLAGEHKGTELVSMVIKRADRLTGGTGLSDNIPIIVEKVIEDLVFTTKEVGALNKSLASLATQQATWGKVPLVGDRIRSERQRVLAEFLRVEETQRRLTGRIEITGKYNKLVDFLALIRIKEGVEEETV